MNSSSQNNAEQVFLQVKRVAAFATPTDDGLIGGNPAGVWTGEVMPSDGVMLEVAKRVGYSETAFATSLNADKTHWKVRYFAPESEVDFCGHATVALGSVLAQVAEGATNNTFKLTINQGELTVEADRGKIAIQSVATQSKALAPAMLDEVMQAFNLSTEQLHPTLKPALGYGGNWHIFLPVNSLETLSQMDYDFDKMSVWMKANSIVTIALFYPESESVIHIRNAFAFGGVFEDPATGAAACALSSVLREQGICHSKDTTTIELKQGDMMKQPCRLWLNFSNQPNSPAKISGLSRVIEA